MRDLAIVALVIAALVVAFTLGRCTCRRTVRHLTEQLEWRTRLGTFPGVERLRRRRRLPAVTVPRYADHASWCNKNAGPNGYAVECDCGYYTVPPPLEDQ